ncbi:30S ribosome-binding factor RbfA [Ferrovibrio sp.]|uniref:30S ribosome-binding factor RbfA n=1 Tax=Ferrovibrio sp. TaxID=1917215 RepID=UPI0026139C0C|nr:30S ribosome-binding factor RbfA [Ferrovibrio sp.]
MAQRGKGARSGARGSRSQAGNSLADLPGGRSQRQLRVGEELRHILSDILLRGHFRDPDLVDGVSVTVTEVRVSPDLRNATAFVMPLGGGKGGGEDATKTIAALNRAQAYIRTEAAHRINLRLAPSFSFKLDESFDEAARVERALLHPAVQADLKKPADDGTEE